MLITDFQQNISLPLAPQERGRWWYANARFQCIVLEVYAQYRDAEGTLRTKYFAFLCGCLEHSSLVATRMLEEVLKELVGPHIHHVDLWSDCGSYEIAACACVVVVRKFAVRCSWNY